LFGFVIALRPQTLKHIRVGWSHYPDTSEPVDGNGAQNMVTVQSGFEPATFRSLAHELTNCSNRAHQFIQERKKVHAHSKKEKKNPKKLSNASIKEFLMYTTCFHDLLPKEVFSVISSIKSMLRC
jgi:hypothetical protein